LASENNLGMAAIFATALRTWPSMPIENPAAGGQRESVLSSDKEGL